MKNIFNTDIAAGTLIAPATRRRCGLLLAVVALASFVLPAFTDPTEVKGLVVTGHEALWLSLTAYQHIEWADLFLFPHLLVFPTALLWAANVGGVLALGALVAGRPLRPLARTSIVLLSVLSLGPLLAVPGDLRIGYYLWAASISAAAFLAALKTPAPVLRDAA
jgi:hypothetical protein